MLRKNYEEKGRKKKRKNVAFERRVEKLLLLETSKDEKEEKR